MNDLNPTLVALLDEAGGIVEIDVVALAFSSNKAIKIYLIHTSKNVKLLVHVIVWFRVQIIFLLYKAFIFKIFNLPENRSFISFDISIYVLYLAL